jgi:hypothetical protein
MKLHVIALALMIGLTPSLTYAQGGGGGGGGGGGAGGGGSASGASAGAGSSAAGSPAAGSAGAGSLGTNGVPPGPANSAGLNNSGNDPSGSGNTPRFNSGTTTGLANPAPATPSNGDVRNSPTTPPGINSAGTAAASGGGGGLRSNGTRMPGPDAPTAKADQDSDAKIDAENQKLDRTVKSICKGC